MKKWEKLRDLDEFTRGYLECSLWSSTDESGEPLDDNYEIEDFSELTLSQAIEDCLAFQEENRDLIAGNLSGAGHDFWLTRNHHGAGFWDGDWKEHGRILTERAHVYGSVDLYVGGDGEIHS